jgi:hypothetical protein
MSKVKHTRQPRQTVRRGLPEDEAYRIRVSGKVMSIVDSRANETGLPVWRVLEELLGVA